MTNRNGAWPDDQAAEAQGFTTEDILWAIGIWSVILTLAPVMCSTC